MTRTWPLVIALVLEMAGAAHAQQRSRPGAGSVLDVAVPARAAAIRIRAEARGRLLDALDGDRDDSIGPAADVLLEQAIARYDAVLEVFPDDFDALFERGIASSAFDRILADGHHDTRIDEAIASLERAREIDPERDAAKIAGELAVLRTRRGEYAAASEEYARAYDARELLPSLGSFQYMPCARREEQLIYLVGGLSAETLLANWAEVTMLSGDPTTAIERYRQAVSQADVASDSAALALWGLALAEERSGSHAEAIETALRAIDADHSADLTRRARLVDRYGAFTVLHLDGVFFEPACEIHAYESLGHEALATRASTAEGRAAEWTAARLSARFFLAEGGRASPYADVATRAEQRLTTSLSGAPTDEHGTHATPTRPERRPASPFAFGH